MNKPFIKAVLKAATVLSCSLMLAFPAQAANARTPVADGTVTYTNRNIVVDASHTSDGYVMVKYSGKAPRIKIHNIHMT